MADEKEWKVTFGGVEFPVSDITYTVKGGSRQADKGAATVACEADLELSYELMGRVIERSIGRPRPLSLHGPTGLRLRPFKFEIKDIVDRRSRIDFLAEVCDKHTGSPLEIGFSLPIDPALGGERRDRRIRTLIAWALMHELDECLVKADGTPLVEPHPERGGRPHPAIAKMGKRAGQRFF